MYAFRCKNCDHLTHAEHAGEHAVPLACQVCAAGIEWGPKATKTFHPENWEVLADAAPDRLAELGLTTAEVAKHTPAKVPVLATAPVSQDLVRTAVDTPGSKDDVVS